MPPQKRKENLLWKLDMLEAQASKDLQNTRLVRTQFAAHKKLNKDKKRERQANPHQEAFANPQRADLIAQEIQDQKPTEPVVISSELQEDIRALRVKLVEQKIFHYKKAIKKAIKASKTTEALKINKRIKKETENPEKVKKHELEKEALKTVDVELLKEVQAVRAIRKEFLGTPEQRESPPDFLPDDIVTLPEDAPAATYYKNASPALESVSQRICGTNAVREATKSMLDAIKFSTKLVKRETASQIAKRKKKEQNEKRKAAKAATKKAAASQGDISGDDEDYSKYDNALAASSDEESEGESILGTSKTPDKKASKSDDEEDSDNEQPVHDDFFALPDENQSENQYNLPELATGYFSGGSDVEDDYDVDNDEVVKEATVQRKNRRGQRARRAIYEMKYGKKANHLQKEQENQKRKREQKQIEFEQREAKRRAMGIEKKSKFEQQAEKQRKHQEEESKPLHPSWEAKKKLSAQPVKFEGKKIVF